MTATKTLSIRLSATGGDQLRREFGKLGKEGEQAFHTITNATRPASLGLKAVDASARALNGVLRQAAGLVGAYAGLQGMRRALGFIVSTNRAFEQLHASLTTVTGSVEAADRAFGMIEDFASSTPFNVTQITEAFIKLKALGLDPSQEALMSYGNTASAMGKNLMQFVEAIADAATGEFERLKEFGIKARTQGEQVSFTFQGVTTTVGKNAAEIEQYLRQIGNVQFAGAMAAQMNTLGGIVSNIEDNFSRLAREVGAGGLNDALRDVASRLKEVTDSGQQTAQALGETLGSVVRYAADGLGMLLRHADLAVEGLAALLIARTVAAAFSALNTAMLGQAGAIVGLRLVAQVSVTAAAKLVVMEGAAKLTTLALGGLRQILAVLGGPAGVIALAGLALYKLAQGHDAAGKAAKDHAAEMAELRQAVQQTTQDIETLNAATRNEALARWSEKLTLAQDNVRAVTQQLKYGAIGGVWDQFSRYGTALQADLRDVRQAFQTGKLSVDQYQDALWALAVKHPDFTDNAKAIQEQIRALQAAELAAQRAGEQMDRLRSGNSRLATPPQTAAPEEPQPTPPSSPAPTSPASSSAPSPAPSPAADKETTQHLKAITAAYAALKAETGQATQKAKAWREEALAGLDQTRAGYDDFRIQIEDVYQNMLKEAREQDLQSSKHWEDGLKRGFRDVLNEAEDMAAQTERLVKNAFAGMETALVDFVTTGKLDFRSFADSIIADLVRIQIRQSITKPLANALGSIDFGSFFGAAHTGGVIGGDVLASRHVNPVVFADAPRFHQGGVVGNEVPIIAQRGETVFTPGQMRLLGDHLAQPTVVNVEVTIHNNAPGIQTRTETTALPEGGTRLDVIVEQIEGQLTRNVARGEGLAPTLERRYGLNPAAGSYR